MALSVALPFDGLETGNFNSFSSFGHIIEIAELAKSQSSPSPSVSSESSGIGSLASLKSESNCDSIPSSPQTTEKKVFVSIAQPQALPVDKIAPSIKYEGRDILDLATNLTNSRWNFKAAVLPPNNPALFFSNRSQYHRLGAYGMRTKYVKDTCLLCGFTRVLAAQD